MPFYSLISFEDHEDLDDTLPGERLRYILESVQNIQAEHEL